MERLPVRVAFLHEGPLSEEQRAALVWCDGVADCVEMVSLGAVADGDASLSGFDAVWWHRDRPLEEARAPTAIREYVEDGGGLLLTLWALAAVEPLGIDPVAPDACGVEHVHHPAGYDRRALHADHPLFEGFERRLHTRAAGADQPFARYELLLPRHGDVLACDLRGDELLVGRKTAVAWQPGAGYAIGLGDALAFDVPGTVEATNTAKLVANALALLGGNRRPTFSGRPADAAGLQAMRARLAGDHHRPRYHLSGPANWLNDPNGLIHHAGTYHVFYQYNPGGPFHNAIHWGHAASEDLVHWRDMPVALAPDPDGPDRDGCWSGCAIPDDDAVRVLYTGGRGRHQLPCLATATDDDLTGFVKRDDNPVIEEAPDDPAILETDDWFREFRDHCVWRSGDEWFQLIGSGVQDVGGAALLYRATDLHEWAYVGPLLVGEWDDAGSMWECPELLDLGEKHLLHVSNYDEVQYYLGTPDFETPDFAVAERGRLDHGDFYAPQSLRAPDGRHLMWGWLRETRDLDAQWEAGWSGVLSVPRELAYEGGDLVQRPARELRELRERHAHAGEHTLAPGEHRALDAPGDGVELALEVAVERGGLFELGVRESPALAERTAVRYDGNTLAVDRSESSLDARCDTGHQSMPVEGPLSLRVFVDGSVLELFANDRRCLSTRIYPTRADATGLSVAALVAPVELSLDVWELGSAWETGR
jgi:beta-fructofuranosidase